MGAASSLDQRGTLAVGEKARGGAYRVVKVQRGSPAEEAGLEVFFDFITRIDDLPLTSPNEETLQAFFAKVNRSTRPEPVQLVVFNARMRGFRNVTLRPAVLSHAQRPAASCVFSLGLSVSFSDVGNVMSEGVRVLSVAPNSPAAHAGLVELEDWILADSQGVFRDVDDLVDSVAAALNRHLQIFVFNSSTERIREVMVVPNNAWGGEGSLGCKLGSGYLHRLPFSRRVRVTEAGAKGEESLAPQAPSAADADSSEPAPSGASDAAGSVAVGSAAAAQARSSTESESVGHSVSPGEAVSAGRGNAAQSEAREEAFRVQKEEGKQATGDREDKEIYILDSDGAPVLLTPSIEFESAYPPYAHALEEEDVWSVGAAEDSDFPACPDELDRPNFEFQTRNYCLYPVTNSPLKEALPLCSDREVRQGDSDRGSDGASPAAYASPYFAYDFPYAAAMARHTSAVFTGPPRPGEVVSIPSLH
ncbi:gorasp2-prov protein [Toxoplasma gondii VAND]|uniref:Gorasp2-prov protein n=2 Tax=Toxoplasma gondii TaxID=5811 RepID=A0A086QCZ8_TOXGO|nr:gorasp2-prov protein [Toxoplasma gondii VAND]